MSDEKKKVKDLATELNQSAKDVITAAKELGIVAAKATTSSLSEAETVRIRNHFAPASDKPEVIVRRRKRVDAPAAEDTPAEAVAVQESAQPESQAETAAPTPAPKGKEKAPKQEPVAARIIQRPIQEEPVAATPPVPPVAEASAAAPQAPVEKAARVVAAKADAPAGQEPSPHAPAQAVAQPQPAAEPAKAQEVTAPEARVVQPAAPAEADAQPKSFARVVRPAVFSAEPERNAKGQTVSSAPVLAPRSDDSDHGDGGTRSSSDHVPGQVRVISRPTEQAPRPARPADGQRPSRPGDGPRPPRPADGQRPPRPGGDGRPPRPGDGQRPAAPGGPRPGGFAPRPAGAGGGAPFAPAGDSEQGRKKRQKGRRTVEFGGENRSRNDGDDAGWNKNSRRRGRKPRETAPLGGTQPVKAVKRIIKMDEFIRVADLAHQMALKSGEIIKVLFNLGIMATINQSLDLDTATLVAQEFGYEVEKVGFFEEEVLSSQQETDKEEDLRPRPPVVTIMGHVDHGKTSLLDAIRTTSVVSGEAGGITQHIGAYHVTTKKGEIVFLDTPGHEAFTAMRARGAEITDIVVLVVAADDGVMEQTREAISHAKAAKVPIMVAVNKMDKPEANPDRVKRELSEQGLVAEDWGGDTTFSYVSAKTREGLDDLLELLALQAEILELKANPDKAAVGHIVEAKLDKGRGALGTVLIQQGTLRLGDNFVCGVHSGRVRAMFNDQGKKVKEAGPSMPVEVQGFEGVPEAGEEFVSIADEKTARRIANARAIKQRERELAKESKVTLETFLARKVDDVEAVVLNLVVKADVQGSLEAITDALNKMTTEKVRINVMHGGTGAISESDVLLASASNAIIIGFNVRPTAKGKELAEAEKVDMRFYDIIYKLVEEIKNAMEGMLAPVSKEVFLGTAEVRETFSVPKIGLVAGCHVSDGKMVRNALARLLRDGVVVYTGKLASLRRFKDDMREVAKGYECGIGLENYNDVKVGDVIEAYEIVEEAAKL